MGVPWAAAFGRAARSVLRGLALVPSPVSLPRELETKMPHASARMGFSALGTQSGGGPLSSPPELETAPLEKQSRIGLRLQSSTSLKKQPTAMAPALEQKRLRFAAARWTRWTRWT